jgi:hypothetical protein
LDQALGGVTSLSLSSSNVTLTQAQAQNGMFRLTGVLLANVSLTPDVSVYMTGMYYFENLTSGSFAVTLTNAGGSVTLPQTRRGIVWIDAANGPRIVSLVGSSTAETIPAGTTMLFYETSVPSGWSLVALNDYGLKVSTSAPGVLSGSIGYSTVFARTSVDATTLTLAQIPSHSHTMAYGVAADNLAAGANTVVTSLGSGASSASTGNSGSGNSHTHGADMRVLTAAVLMATRD